VDVTGSSSRLRRAPSAAATRRLRRRHQSPHAGSEAAGGNPQVSVMVLRGAARRWPRPKPMARLAGLGLEPRQSLHLVLANSPELALLLLRRSAQREPSPRALPEEIAHQADQEPGDGEHEVEKAGRRLRREGRPHYPGVDGEGGSGGDDAGSEAPVGRAENDGGMGECQRRPLAQDVACQEPAGPRRQRQDEGDAVSAGAGALDGGPGHHPVIEAAAPGGRGLHRAPWDEAEGRSQAQRPPSGCVGPISEGRRRHGS
jgi:hypothetical protein